MYELDEDRTVNIFEIYLILHAPKFKQRLDAIEADASKKIIIRDMDFVTVEMDKVVSNWDLLPDDSTFIDFTRFLRSWFHKQKVVERFREMKMLRVLCHAWFFGEKHGIPIMQNDVVEVVFALVMDMRVFEWKGFVEFCVVLDVYVTRRKIEKEGGESDEEDDEGEDEEDGVEAGRR